MTDYEQLVKALRCETSNGGDCWEKKCQYLVCGSYAYCNSKRIMSDAAAAIEALQAQLPKRGKWIEDAKTYAGPGLSNYKCSLCGKICGTWRRGLEPSELPNWCGNCGADMRAKMEVQDG